MKILKWIGSYAYAIWLGVGTGILGYHTDNPKWWIMCVPMVLLVSLATGIARHEGRKNR